MPDPRVVAAAAASVPEGWRATTPSRASAEALIRAGVLCDVADLADLAADSADAVVLLADELTDAGEHAEGLVASVEVALRPGGVAVVSARSMASAPPDQAARSFTSGELHRALGHRGLAVEGMLAPGAAALVSGDPDGPLDPDRDRWPGLLDAGRHIVAVARKGATPSARSTTFFATVPRKVVAAAVVCRDDAGRLLVVHDSFKQHWTIPGGVVDPDEDPRSAAIREAWEEAGVHVAAGTVVGVFAASWPDRVVLLYDARPHGDVVAGHRPVHAHEIDDVDWLPLPEALARLAPHVAEQVRLSLEDPGGTHVQHHA